MAKEKDVVEAQERVEAQENEPVKQEAEAKLDVIHPVAFDIRLMSHHPHDSYGRCGYRFNKNDAMRIPADELTGEKISRLFDDPYLEIIPVTEE